MNQLTIELYASVDRVWELVGAPNRLPEYSSGLDSVVASKNTLGQYTGYVCYFRPINEKEAGITHHSSIKWYSSKRGWASLDEEPNAFGLTDSWSIIQVSETANGTLFNWQQYYNALDKEASKTAFDTALKEIGLQLIQKFGGRLIEQPIAVAE